jgi:hypothetical protein
VGKTMKFFRVIESFGSGRVFISNGKLNTVHCGSHFVVEYIEQSEAYLRLITKGDIETETSLYFVDNEGTVELIFETFDHPNVNLRIEEFFAEVIANPTSELFIKAIFDTMKFIEEMFSVFASNSIKSAR